MENISVNDNTLTVNGTKISFTADINMIVEINGVVAVLLWYSGHAEDIRSIYGVIDGRIMWQVQDVREYNSNFVPDIYVGIRIYEKEPNLILATDFDGSRYLINPHNGKIVGTESWVK